MTLHQTGYWRYTLQIISNPYVIPDMLDSPTKAPPSITLSWLVDETFFSICSRHNLIWGHVDPAVTFRMLFNTTSTYISHDFPNHLDALRGNISSMLGSADEIVCRHTIVPLFFPFQSREHVQTVMAVLRGPHLGSIKYRLGLVTGRFGAEHPLKACSGCMEADVQAHGVAYWHLAHQYPGVIICPTHKLWLQESTLNRQWSGRFQWALPEKATLVPSANETVHRAQYALLQLASSVLELADFGTSRSFDPQIVRAVYRTRLREMGFLNPSSPKAAALLAGHTVELQPFHPFKSLPTTAQGASTYIQQLVRNPHGHCHPLKHLVMITWLFGQLSAFIEAYDRMESNHDQEPSSRAERSKQGTSLARLAKPDIQTCNTLRPKVLKPPIRSAILELLSQGLPKADICAQFNITVSTINKLLRAEPKIKLAWAEATHLNKLRQQRLSWTSLTISHPNSSPKVIRAENPKLYAWLYRNDKAWLLHETASLPTGRTGNNSNIDWELRDKELKDSLFRLLGKGLEDERHRNLKNNDIFTLNPDLSSCLERRDQYPRTRAFIREIKQRR